MRGLQLAIVLSLLGLGCSAPKAGAQSSGSNPEPPATGIDCESLTPCPDAPCGEAEGCYFLEACGEARCMPEAEVCTSVCNSSQCAIAESFPMQVMCEGGTPEVGPQPVPPPADDPCAEAEAALQREVEKLTRCDTDAQCGQVLEGTSCGCTRNVVARLDADLATFQTRQARLQELGCGGMVSTCDCPPADGYVCAEGHCTWNYK